MLKFSEKKQKISPELCEAIIKNMIIETVKPPGLYFKIEVADRDLVAKLQV